jgi:molybdopterin molybdotransferase
VPADLLPLESAQARLLGLVTPLARCRVPLGEAAGRLLAADLAARLTQPPADVSAMDGYALRFADLGGSLRIVGASAAGAPLARALGAREAARIFTGGVVPAGADTILVQEEAAVEGEVLRRLGEGPPGPGAHIRRRGLDFSEGAAIARAGDRLTPAMIGLVAAAGHAEVPVRRRPRVALVATGSELVPPGVTPGPGQIVSSNAAMLAALLAREGAEVEDAGIVPDDRPRLEATLRRAAGAVDVVVTIGGASVGDHDLVRPALEAVGARIDFWRIAIRPGKPLLAGTLRDTVVVGLPGNPVSAYVCALLFLLPLVRHLGGDPAPLPIAQAAIAGRDLPENGPRRDFQRATLAASGGGLPIATPASAQDSSMLSVLAVAQCLLIRPEGAPAVPAGDTVPVLRL